MCVAYIVAVIDHQVFERNLQNLIGLKIEVTLVLVSSEVRLREKLQALGSVLIHEVSREHKVEVMPHPDTCATRLDIVVLAILCHPLEILALKGWLKVTEYTQPRASEYTLRVV